MRVNAVEPGFTKTDLTGNSGGQTVEQGAETLTASCANAASVSSIWLSLW
jgi:hypothetical protein